MAYKNCSFCKHWDKAGAVLYGSKDRPKLRSTCSLRGFMVFVTLGTNCDRTKPANIRPMKTKFKPIDIYKGEKISLNEWLVFWDNYAVDGGFL